jgi:hypothetical protein
MVGRWWCCSVVHREEEKSREMKRRTVAARGRKYARVSVARMGIKREVEGVVVVERGGEDHGSGEELTLLSCAR